MNYRVNGVKFYTRSRAEEAALALDAQVEVEISDEELADIMHDMHDWVEAAKANRDMGRDELHG